MIIDLARILLSVYFLTETSGGQVVECSQNTSILLIPVSIIRSK